MFLIKINRIIILFSTLDLIWVLNRGSRLRRRERRRRLRIWFSYLVKIWVLDSYEATDIQRWTVQYVIFYFHSFQINNFRPLRHWFLILRLMLKIRILMILINQLEKRMKNPILTMTWFNYNFVTFFQFLISSLKWKSIYI